MTLKDHANAVATVKLIKKNLTIGELRDRSRSALLWLDGEISILDKTFHVVYRKNNTVEAFTVSSYGNVLFDYRPHFGIPIPKNIKYIISLIKKSVQDENRNQSKRFSKSYFFNARRNRGFRER